MPGGFVRTDVYIRFEDSHGLFSESVHRVFYHDPLPPTAEMAIEGGAAHTDTHSVYLDLAYQDNAGVASVEVSNDDQFRNSVSVTPGVHRLDAWELVPGDSGERRVYMRVIDLAGNMVVVLDQIDVYIAEALGSVEIIGGTGATNSQILQLSITAPTEIEVLWMQVSEDPMFSYVEWTDLGTYAAISLAEGDGNREIFVRFKEVRGYTTLPVSVQVLLDTTPPEISVVVNDGVYLTQVTVVDVTVDYSDISEPGEMWIGSRNDFDQADQMHISYGFPWTIPEQEGIHTLNVWMSDVLGNVGHSTASVYYAIVPPYCVPSIVGGKYSNSLDELEVEVQAIDQYGLPVEVQLGFDGDPAEDAPWVPSEGILKVQIPAGSSDGRYHVTVRGRNTLGLISDVVSTEVILDRKPPECTIKAPGNGTVETQSSAEVDLRFDAADENGVRYVRYRLDDGEWTEIDPRDRAEEIHLDAFGTHELSVWVVDDAGNEVISTTTFTVERDWTPQMVMGGTIIGVVALVAFLFYRRKRGPEAD
jgi:hypothetical protein